MYDDWNDTEPKSPPACEIELSPPAEPAPVSEGIFALPVIGQPLRATRALYNSLEPKQDDSLGVAIAKNVARYTTVAAAALIAGSLSAIVCL